MRISHESAEEVELRKLMDGDEGTIVVDVTGESMENSSGVRTLNKRGWKMTYPISAREKCGCHLFGANLV